MTVQEALKKALEDLRALSPEALRAELDKHSKGEIAIALKETQDFLYPK